MVYLLASWKGNRDIDCLCCQEVPAISDKNFEGDHCITVSKQFQTLCLEKLVLKNVLVELHMKLKEISLKKKMKSKVDHCTLLSIYNFYGGYIEDLGKKTGEFSHHVFCGKLDITQKQMNSMIYIMTVKKIDKNNIDINHSLCSSKSWKLFFIYLLLLMSIRVSNGCNGCNGCKASRLQVY